MKICSHSLLSHLLLVARAVSKQESMTEYTDRRNFISENKHTPMETSTRWCICNSNEDIPSRKPPTENIIHRILRRLHRQTISFGLEGDRSNKQLAGIHEPKGQF